MGQMNSPDSPLETVSEAFGPNATDSFAILGNETRLAILLALWENLEPFSEDPTDYTAGDSVTFSELRQRVGMRDPGQFHYHLDRLVDRFVLKSDDGFELNTVGKQVVWTIIASVGFEEQSTELTEISEPCPYCGAPSAVTYQNHRIYQLCTECEGSFSIGDKHPESVINGWKSSPPIVNHGAAEEVFQASQREAAHLYALRYDGICHHCSGPITRSLHVCEDHEAEDDTCLTCNRRFEVGARFICSVCKDASICPLLKAVLVPRHRPIDEFLINHGITPEFPYLTEIPGLETDEWIESADPIRVRMTLSIEDEQLDLLIDEAINVVEATG